MIRSGPPQRRTPLARKPIKRKPSKAKRARFAEDRVDQERRIAQHRSRGGCELCRDAPATEIHHRRRRSAGGLDHHTNYLDLCHSCHHVTIHGNTGWAMRHGLLLSRHTTDHPPPVIGCPLECEIDHYA
jgi:hypothetical protein